MARRPLTARPWAPHALALACYTLMALAVTYPLPLHLGERIIANKPGEVDGYLGIWNIWWAARALTTPRDPFVTPLLFHPQGLDLFWQTLSLPQGILALPITLTLGPLLAYNILILLSFILGGYFAFLFIRAALDDNAPYTDPAALVGGAVYAFAPFHMQKVIDAQLEVASVQWLPLWALGALVLLRRPSWPRAMVAGALLLWVGLGTWYYGLFALIAAGLMAGLWALRVGEADGPAGGLRLPGVPVAVSPRALLWGLAPLALWFVVMTPRLISLAQTGDTLLGDIRGAPDSFADLVAFWLPNPNHPLWGEAVSAFYLRIHPEAVLWNISLGIVGTVLGFVGVAAAWRTQWRWLALGVVAAAFALGAELVVGGRGTGIPGPYALIRDLPGVRSSHRPNHFVVIAILTTALFAAAGARVLLGRLGRVGAPLAAAGLLAFIFAVDGWVGPQRLFQRPMPAPYLAMPAPDGALLPVPLHINFSNSENLWYQTRHGWPIIGGFIGREPPYPLARYAPGINELRFGRAERDDILSPGWPELARETLAAYDISYVMFHRRTMGSSLPLMEDLIAEMGLASTYTDELIAVHPVPAPPVARPLAYLGPGWGELERQGDTRWRWVGESAQVYLLNPTGAPRSVRLTLTMEAFEQARPLTIRLGDGPPFTLEVSRARMTRSLRLMLPPGETVLYLDAPAGSPPGQPERRLSLAVMGISIQ